MSKILETILKNYDCNNCDSVPTILEQIHEIRKTEEISDDDATLVAFIEDLYQYGYDAGYWA